MANGFAKVKDINDGTIAKCAIHEKDIQLNKDNLNGFSSKIDKKIALILRWLIAAALLLGIDLGSKAIPYIIKFIIG